MPIREPPYQAGENFASITHLGGGVAPIDDRREPTYIEECTKRERERERERERGRESDGENRWDCIETEIEKQRERIERERNTGLRRLVVFCLTGSRFERSLANYHDSHRGMTRPFAFLYFPFSCSAVFLYLFTPVTNIVTI